METNQTVSTEFDLPPSLPSGSYSLTVIANGIPSTSYPFPVSIIWVDFSAGNSGNGTFANPYNTLAAGVSAVPAGGIIKIEGGGSSAETLPINKAMTIVAYNGAVTIGSNSGSPSTGAVVISGTQPAKITIEAAKTSAPVTRHRPQPGTPVKR
jgi:hypothetical protein